MVTVCSTSLSVYMRKEMSSYSERTPSPPRALFMDLPRSLLWTGSTGVPIMLMAANPT